MVTRSIPQMTTDDLKVVARNVNAACEELGCVSWIRSHVTSDGRHSFCEFEGPDSDSIRRHAELAGLPVDTIVPLGLEIGPVMTRNGTN